MIVRITSMNGSVKDIELPNANKVYEFMELYKNKLNKNHRVKITCDLLGIDGYLQGQG